MVVVALVIFLNTTRLVFILLMLLVPAEADPLSFIVTLGATEVTAFSFECAAGAVSWWHEGFLFVSIVQAFRMLAIYKL